MPNNELFQTFVDKKDYKGLADFAIDIFTRVAIQAPNAEQDKADYFDFIEQLATAKEGEELPEKNKQAINGIFGQIYLRTGDAVIACEKNIRENEKKLKDGEVPELSLLLNDQGKVRKAAEGITYMQQSSGLVNSAIHQLFMTTRSAVHNAGYYDDKNIEATDIQRNTVLKKMLKEAYPDIPDEKLNEPEYLVGICNCEFDSVEGFRIDPRPVGLNGNLFIGVNQDHQAIKAIPTRELKYEIKDKEEEIKLLNETNQKLSKLADDASELLNEIEEIDGVDTDNKYWKLFDYEIKNITKFGTDEHMSMWNENNDVANNPDRIAKDSVVPKIYGFALNALGQTITHLKNEYEGKDTEEAKAAMEAVAKAEKFKEEHRRIYEEAKKIYDDHQFVQNDPNKALALLKQEQENRNIHSESLVKARANCAARDKKIYTVELYTASAQRGLDALESTMKSMAEDSLRHTSTHSTYNDFANRLSELSAMKAGDTKPQQLLDKMKAAYDAAVAYEESHTGWKHPLSGLTDEGKDRIRFARLTKEILGRKIEELTPTVEAIGPVVGESTPNACATKMNNDNAEIRSVIQDEINRLKDLQNEQKNIKESDNTVLDEKIYEAQRSLKKKKAALGEDEYPEKDEIKNDCTKIVSALNLKRVINKGEHLNDNTFDLQCRVMSKNLKSVFEANTSEQLYKQATTNNGQQLYQTYAADFKAKADREAAVKNVQPKALAKEENKAVKSSVKKNTEPVKRK